MPRPLVGLVGVVIALGGPASAFEVSATIKSVDAEQRVVQFHARQQDRSAKVAPDAKILDSEGEPLAAGLKAEVIKPGAQVILTVEAVDGRPLIRGIKLGVGGGTLAPSGQSGNN